MIGKDLTLSQQECVVYSLRYGKALYGTEVYAWKELDKGENVAIEMYCGDVNGHVE